MNTSKPMFDKDGKFIMGKFESVVNGVKDITELALEAERLQSENVELKGKLSISDVFTDNVDVLGSNPEGRVEKIQPSNVSDHSDKTQGRYAISMENGRFNVIIHAKSPETGKDTTYGGKADTLVAAIVKRDRKAQTLLREGIIDFARYQYIVTN